MYPGTPIPRYYGDVTGTYFDSTGRYVDTVSWYSGGYVSKKKPFSLSEFIQNKQRVTESWHEPFQYELARWRQMGKTNMVLCNYFWRRTVEYVMKIHLSVDWRWVFKRWLQDLYAD